MADVFISYSHDDQDFVRKLVPALESEGLSVWWDHTIPPGQSWDTFIARGIEDAKACIIVWSPRSIASDWVKEEATLAKDGGKYLPVQFGGDQPPVGFRRIQAANLSAWRGDTTDPQFRMLAQAARNLVGGERAPLRHGPGLAPAPVAKPPSKAPLFAGIAVVALAVVGYAVMNIGPGAPPTKIASAEPTTLATPQEASPSPDTQNEMERLRAEAKTADEQRAVAERAAKDASAKLEASERAARDAAESLAARERGAANADQTRIQPGWVLGIWKLSWQGASGQYTGTVDFKNQTEAVLTINRAADKAGVVQKARVTISAKGVEVDGYEIVSERNTSGWNPDNFFLARAGEKLVGYSLDDAGSRGPRIELYR